MIQIGFGGADEIGQAAAVQSDGLLLVAGLRQDTSQIILVRFGTNNLPDPSFGSGGVARLFRMNGPTRGSIARRTRSNRCQQSC